MSHNHSTDNYKPKISIHSCFFTCMTHFYYTFEDTHKFMKGSNGDLKQKHEKTSITYASNSKCNHV